MYPKAYIQYLAHFHGDRDYFECHEVLEEYWKEIDSGNRKSIWVGFILLAVSCYHHRRLNFPGSLRTLHKAIELFTFKNKEIEGLGIDANEFLSVLHSQYLHIKNGEDYSSIDFPLTDVDLEKECENYCRLHYLKWKSKSDMENHSLIHRHHTRDRSGVISERNLAKRKKQKGRE